MELYLQHDTSSGVQYAKQIAHEETVSSPVTEITIEHPLDKRRVRVTLFDADSYLLPPSRIDTCQCGEHSPVTSNRYFVHIIFNGPFSGFIRLDY